MGVQLYFSAHGSKPAIKLRGRAKWSEYLKNETLVPDKEVIGCGARHGDENMAAALPTAADLSDKPEIELGRVHRFALAGRPGALGIDLDFICRPRSAVCFARFGTVH